MLGGLNIEMAALRSAGTHFKTVDGPCSTLSKQVLHHQELHRFWWPLALPEQGKRIKLQHAVYTN